MLCIIRFKLPVKRSRSVISLGENKELFQWNNSHYLVINYNNKSEYGTVYDLLIWVNETLRSTGVWSQGAAHEKQINSALKEKSNLIGVIIRVWYERLNRVILMIL